MKSKQTTTSKKRSGRKTTRRKSNERRKNIDGNFRGSEDIFFIKISNGIKKFFESPFRKV